LLRKPYLYILAICFFCCEEAPDFGTVDSADTPIVDIQTSETTFTEFPIEIEWEGNTAAREFIYELQFVDDPSIPHSWSGSNTTNETSMTFDNLDEGSYTFSVQGLYNQDNIGDVVTLDFIVNVIPGPALRIYPLSQTANIDDVIDVYLYFEEVPEDSSVTGLHVGIQVNTDEFEFMSDYPDSLNVEDDGIRYGELITDFFGTTINPDPIYSHSEDDPMAVLSIMGVAVDSSGTGIYGTGSIAKFRLKVLTCCEPQNINIYQQDLLNINGDAHSFNEPVSGSVTVESVLQ